MRVLIFIQKSIYGSSSKKLLLEKGLVWRPGVRIICSNPVGFLAGYIQSPICQCLGNMMCRYRLSLFHIRQCARQSQAAMQGAYR